MGKEAQVCQVDAIALRIYVVAAIVLLSPAESFAKKLAVHGNLTAHVDDAFVCQKQVTVRLESRSERAFPPTGDRANLETLAGIVRAAVSFDCPAVEAIAFNGFVQGQEVYRGMAAATGSWVLQDQRVVRDGGPSEPPPQPAQSAAPPVQDRPKRDSPPIKAYSPEERVRLFGEHGERAFRPLLAKAYGYRAALMQLCMKEGGANAVAEDMAGYFKTHLPESLPAAQKAFGAAQVAKDAYLPPCNSEDYKIALSWNAKEIKGQQAVMQDSIYNFSDRVAEMKQLLSQLALYAGSNDGVPDEKFWTALKEWSALSAVNVRKKLATGDYTNEFVVPLRLIGVSSFRDTPWPFVEELEVAEPTLVVMRQSVRKGVGGSWAYAMFGVAFLQNLLRGYGYYDGTIDGSYFGGLSQKGGNDLGWFMRKYAEEHPDLSKIRSKNETIYDPHTLGFLGYSEDAAYNGFISAALREIRDTPNRTKVRLVQPFLLKMGWLGGFSPGYEAGILDLELIQSLEAFQQCKMQIETLKSTGKVPTASSAPFADSHGVIASDVIRDLKIAAMDGEEQQRGRNRWDQRKVNKEARPKC